MAKLSTYEVTLKNGTPNGIPLTFKAESTIDAVQQAENAGYPKKLILTVTKEK